MGPCNGARDVDARGVGRVVKVLVRHGDTVDAVSVLYDRGGREEWTWTDLWGGPGGCLSPGLCGHCNSRQVCLRRDEYLTSVGGHCPLRPVAGQPVFFLSPFFLEILSNMSLSKRFLKIDFYLSVIVVGAKI
jgi:hypothetical protein